MGKRLLLGKAGITSFPFEGEAHFGKTTLTVTFKEDGRWSASGTESHGDAVLVDEPIHTKPFNLEAALKGEPVVTRDGRKVIDLKRFETVSRIYGVLDGAVTGWGVNGSLLSSGESKADLFMTALEPKIREIWLNVYADAIYSHETEKDADLHSSSNRIGKARRILVPEEEA